MPTLASASGTPLSGVAHALELLGAELDGTDDGVSRVRAEGDGVSDDGSPAPQPAVSIAMATANTATLLLARSTTSIPFCGCARSA
jgi:hypothetical protein